MLGRDIPAWGVVMNRSAKNKIVLAAFCLTPCLVATGLSPVAAKAESGQSTSQSGQK
jgi:hypothetical protein